MTMQDQATEHRVWTVSGMDCASCATKVRGAVERLLGVSQVNSATMTERLSLALDSALTLPEKVESTAKALGYGIAPREPWYEGSFSPVPGIRAPGGDRGVPTHLTGENQTPI